MRHNGESKQHALLHSMRTPAAMHGPRGRLRCRNVASIPFCLTAAVNHLLSDGKWIQSSSIKSAHDCGSVVCVQRS